MNENKYEASARAYLSSDKTVTETAKELGISKRTLQLHLGKIKDINPELHKLVLAKKTSQITEGRKKGGTVGKKTSSHSEKEVLEIARTMIQEEMSYVDAEARFGIPKSTIYELLHKIDLPAEIKHRLDTLAEANKKNKSISEYIESKRPGV